MTTDIVIASAARTPVGSFNGALANTPAHDLGVVAIKAAKPCKTASQRPSRESCNAIAWASLALPRRSSVRESMN